MATTTGQKFKLQVRRSFKASPERLFEAWTAPEELKRWHAPAPAVVSLVEIDARAGGRYRIHMRDPEGREFHVSGEYRVVDRPRRLVFTWKWEHEDITTQVTLEFKPQGSGTELVLTHEGLPSEASKGRHEHGWNGIFDKLVERFGA